MADRYAKGTGNWTAANTAIWSATDGGATGVSVPTSSDNVIFTSNTGTITITATGNCADFTLTGGTFAGTSGLNVFGSVSLGGTITYSGTLTMSATASGKTFASNGKTFPGNITFNGVNGAWTLSDAPIVSGTVTLTNGSISDGGFTPTMSVFNTNNSNTRSITKTTEWVITGTGTCVNFTSTTGLTISSSGGWKLTDSSATARTFATGGLTFTGTVKVTAGTGTLNISGTPTLGGLDFTGYGGALQNSAISVTGSVTLGASMSVADGAAALSMTGSGAATFKSNGVQFNRNLTINGTGSVTLQDALALGTRTLTVTQGDFSDGGFNVTANAVSSNNSNTRSITKTGLWSVSGTGTVLNFATATGLTLSSAGGWNFTNTSATARQFNLGGLTFGDTFTLSGAMVQTITAGGGSIGTLAGSSFTGSIVFGFGGGITYTFGTWSLSGTLANPIAVSSNSAGARVVLRHSGSGNVTADYLSMQDCDCGPGYQWFVGAHSTNNGNNAGVAFTTAANASSMMLAA